VGKISTKFEDDPSLTSYGTLHVWAYVKPCDLELKTQLLVTVMLGTLYGPYIKPETLGNFVFLSYKCA